MSLPLICGKKILHHYDARIIVTNYFINSPKYEITIILQQRSLTIWQNLFVKECS
ncbi:hypothetical protein HMPREF9444_02127 [Succinatimonas hippei YIT 12066]|uniref:Uncharacterized protein n=1 Tax=Succinatimonas hippei (strain DSM 22608 / JCM 16073 / KCTC 15190 / YIT 12066) TaxID=762983 RepID=E8LMX8_SUCHY|nr:hypothetical protein HMPREF9444_02127 [Succinatimonas hippei YIT 12066]